MKLIVGLGNPGDKYKKTRHNIGFEIIDQYVNSNNIGDFSYDNKYGGEVLTLLNPPSQGGLSNVTEKIIFLKPMEYMNKSGQAVQKLMNFYKIEAKDLLVIHDDIDLGVGVVKLKLDGGLAGHNGLKDIAEKLGTKDFNRVRIGIDRPLSVDQVSDYVLSNFKKEEIEKIQDKYLDIEGLISEFLGK
ncbi:MAG TPA: aminoacyl-tRNA hydrolase [Candidatus Absconditabacterales bacterium]|nr:aminoacyl-tRNA hydrolase [Candidatus Absconditabacterales bacterium]